MHADIFWEARKNDMQRADYALAQIQLLYDVGVRLTMNA